MHDKTARRGHAGVVCGLTLGLWGGTIALTAAESRAFETPPSQAQVASSSVAPAEHSQEALLREVAQSPFLPPEIFSDLPYAVPAPFNGGLGVEVE